LQCCLSVRTLQRSKHGRHKEHTRLLFFLSKGIARVQYPRSIFSRHSTALAVRLAARFCDSATDCASSPLPLSEATGQCQVILHAAFLVRPMTSAQKRQSGGARQTTPISAQASFEEGRGFIEHGAWILQRRGLACLGSVFWLSATQTCRNHIFSQPSESMGQAPGTPRTPPFLFLEACPSLGSSPRPLYRTMGQAPFGGRRSAWPH
jgi:hypothetical protein